jgi:hypothetical protein
MSAYEPGTVAVATVRGVKDVRVMRVAQGYGASPWRSGVEIAGYICHHDCDLTDVRPLVVLDLMVPGSKNAIDHWLREAARLLRGANQNTVARILSAHADQIEAQTKPSRIPEPGLWGVVNARGGEYVNVGAGWLAVSSGVVHTWDYLIDPVLVREGLS